MQRHLLYLLLLFNSPIVFAQQIADSTYNPPIPDPMYAPGKGPVIFIDEGHHNFHTKEGRYQAFAHVLERDGYRVLGHNGNFTHEALMPCRILVISNALNERNVEDWSLPTPSAFSPEEIETVRSWVSDGGSLFLIADHMPLAGAASDLAKAFGFVFTNGFVFDTTTRGPAYFSIPDGSLIESPVTRGRDARESVDNIATFTGQGFSIPAEATPVLRFDDRYINILPDTAWVFSHNIRKESASGLYQGAFEDYGKGKVAVFGEAAMFTAQLAGPNHTKVGMSSDDASQNFQLLLNLVHWLDRGL